MQKGWFTIFKVKVTAKGQNISVCPDDIFQTNYLFVTKFGVVIHHHEPECHAKRVVCYSQGRGHSKGSYDHDSLYYIFWTADPFVIKPSFIVHYHTPVCIHAYRYGSTYLLLKIISEIWIAFQSSRFCHSRNQHQSKLFQFFPRTYQSHFWMHCTRAKAEICRLAP